MNTTFYTAAGGFLLLTLIYFGLLLRALFRGADQANWPDEKKKQFKRNSILGLIAWAAAVTAWSGSGIMSDFTIFPFNFMPVLIVPLVVILVTTFSGKMTDVLSHVPAHHIIRLQTFRFFVEMMLWLLFIGNQLPVQMTFEGYNFDIVAGITSAGVAWMVSRRMANRSFIIGWNIFCLLLLINIVTIAILSTPTPVRVFMNDPANYIVAVFPISFLPGFLVPLAYMLHFFSLRQLALGVRVSPAPSVV
jgi:hypothetical protein